VSDWIATGKNAADVSARAEAAPSWSPPPPPEPVGGERALIVRRASDITLEPVQWVWPGRVAVGKLTLIAGDPGLGKSQIAIYVAATMTSGGRWPCDEGRCEPGSVIMLSAEDDAADTIVPRLKAAGADTERVHIVPAVLREDGKGRRSFNLAEDLDLLEKKISELEDVRLIIIDPISSYMGKGDANKNTDVRQVLEPIGEMAARLRVAILCITHLTKGDGKALYRSTGSIAFVAAARAAFIVTADPDDETRRFFLQSKNNLAKPAPGLSFRLEQHLVQDGIIGSAVVWGNEPVERTADEALSSSGSVGGITGKDDAADFLRDALSQGPADVLEVEQQARSAGLLGDNQRLRQSKAFRMAREALGVLYRREGFGTGARYVLSLPAASCAPSNPMRAPLQDRAHMHSQGAHDEGVQR
jgi:putative DNA primase/helicase